MINRVSLTSDDIDRIAESMEVFTSRLNRLQRRGDTLLNDIDDALKRTRAIIESHKSRLALVDEDEMMLNGRTNVEALNKDSMECM